MTGGAAFAGRRGDRASEVSSGGVSPDVLNGAREGRAREALRGSVGEISSMPQQPSRRSAISPVGDASDPPAARKDGNLFVRG